MYNIVKIDLLTVKSKMLTTEEKKLCFSTKLIFFLYIFQVKSHMNAQTVRSASLTLDLTVPISAAKNALAC